MESIIINRFNLLEKLRENRDHHVKAYKEAYDEYHKQYIKALYQHLKEVKKGKANFHWTFNQATPFNKEDDYNTIIHMMEMSVEESIKLSHGDFLKYIEDKWEWKLAFENTAAFYNNTH